MPKLIKPLSEQEVRKAKAKEKQYKLYDGNGLHIKIFPTGIKRWVLDFTFNKKRNSISFGNYPEVSLKKAREKRAEAREKIKNGINPAKKQVESKKDNTFETIAREYFKRREDLSAGYIKDSLQKLKKDIFPYFKNRNIDNIEPLEMLGILQIIDNRGANVSAKRTFSIVHRIYGYAVTIGKTKRNILNDLDKKIAFRTVKKKNFAHTIDPKELRDILLAIEEYSGDYSTKMALSILPYVFVRPSNLRYMEWEEINFEKSLWTIPKEKMKTDKDHLVPLTDTVMNVINKMKCISYQVSIYVFPSRISNSKVLSENTLNFALKRMGFNVTSHGFRHTASTLLHENIENHKIQSDAIEIQLAHTVGSQTQQVYNKAQYLSERTKLMNWWSDYLDNLKKS
jgi:integrase